MCSKMFGNVVICLVNIIEGNGEEEFFSNGLKRELRQSNLLIQCNPYQTTHGIFHRIRTKYFAICMETKKDPK